MSEHQDPRPRDDTDAAQDLARDLADVAHQISALMGEANVALPLASKPPTIVLMAGLQGSGKTTCAAKLARHFRSQGRAPEGVGMTPLKTGQAPPHG